MSTSYNLRSNSPNLSEEPPIRQIGYQDINSRRLARQTARNRASSFSSTTSFFNNLLNPTLEPLPTSDQTSPSQPLPDSTSTIPPSGLPPHNGPSANAAIPGSITFRSRPLQLVHLESKFFSYKVSDLLIHFNRLTSWNGSLLTFYSSVHLPLTLLAESYDMLDCSGVAIYRLVWP